MCRLVRVVTVCVMFSMYITQTSLIFLQNVLVKTTLGFVADQSEMITLTCPSIHSNQVRVSILEPIYKMVSDIKMV